jgi:TPR repeat protein
MTWYLKAANLGHVGSQHNVGFFHDNGIGVRQDYAQAMVWCLNTAEQGHPNSQYNIGTLYQRGEGVFQNYEISAE